jgi:hypothetical protein
MKIKVSKKGRLFPWHLNIEVKNKWGMVGDYETKWKAYMAIPKTIIRNTINYHKTDYYGNKTWLGKILK